MTLSDKLTLAEGRPSGFDLMRITLSIAVVCWHSVYTTMGASKTLELLATTPMRAPVALLLPMFFGLSGFLVTGSLLRSKSLISFLGLRALRLGPALAIEVILSALVLGPLLTSLPLSEYFSDPKFLHYFLNILGDIQYKLPGLFLNNPSPELVNLQLWTVPFELKCYVAIAILATLGIAFDRIAFVLLLGITQLAIIYYVLAYHPAQEYSVPHGRILVLCFLFGVGFYLWRDVIPYNGALALVSAALCLWLPLSRYGDYFLAGPALYLTCYLGLANPRRSRFLTSGDYSYGIFLYGFPIQQATLAILPSTEVWWINILICVPISIVFATGSWHLVEKHAPKLRPCLVMIEEAVLSRFSFVRFWARPARIFQPSA